MNKSSYVPLPKFDQNQRVRRCSFGQAGFGCKNEFSTSFVTIHSLSKSQKIPKSFLGKILDLCAKKGLIQTKSDPLGGVRLAKPSQSLTLLKIIEASEGSLSHEHCLFYPQRSCDEPVCSVHCPLRQEEEKARAALSCITLAEMIEPLKIHPDATHLAVQQIVVPAAVETLA